MVRSCPRWWYCGRRTIELLEDCLLRVVVCLASQMLGIPGPGVIPTLLDRRKPSERRKIDARDEFERSIGGAGARVAILLSGAWLGLGWPKDLLAIEISILRGIPRAPRRAGE